MSNKHKNHPDDHFRECAHDDNIKPRKWIKVRLFCLGTVDVLRGMFYSLAIMQDMSVKVQTQTMGQSASTTWHFLRKKRITASKFGLVARRQSNFDTLVKHMNPTYLVQTAAMKRGIDLEPHAAMIYASIEKAGKVNWFSSGLVIHPQCPWLGCSPD